MTPLQMLEDIKKGQIRALSKAITLVESSHRANDPFTKELLALLPNTDPNPSIRIAISGPPGVGKSTFIEAIGMLLLRDKNNKIAVLAIDPSSPDLGGSILADKTRMSDLSTQNRAYVRPSPSGKALGGVTRSTREAIALCELAGFNHIIIETVGVGQSEVAASFMTDVFVTLQMPGAGDEIQGMKKGILELSDIIVVNKCDQNHKHAADSAISQLAASLQLTCKKSTWTVPVVGCSSLNGQGLDAVLKTLDEFIKHQKASGAYQEKRRSQAIRWFEDELPQRLFETISSDKVFNSKSAFYLNEIAKSERNPIAAIESMVSQLDIKWR